jgi:copper transport protein
VRILALLVWLAGVALATPVQAHAVLVETIPADRAVLAEAPAQIVLRFNEPVRAVAAQVLDQEARRVAGDDVRSTNDELRIGVPQPLAAGTYVVSYRVISADAHPVSGSFLFAVGAAPETWLEQTAPAKPPVHWPAVASVARALFLAGAMVVAGGAIFLLLFHRGDRGTWQRLQPIATLAAVGASIAAVLSVGLQGALIAGAGSNALFNGAVWRLGAESTRGTAALVAIIGLVLTAFAISRSSRWLAIVGVATIIASFALSGHAATAMPRYIAVPVLLLHAAGAAFWLGSFVPLLMILDNCIAVATIFRRFSWRALVIVPMVLLAGLVLAILQVRHLEALPATNYGITLMLKLALVAALLVIAFINRRVLTPRLSAGRPEAFTWLRITIRAELVLGFLILVMTSILSQTIPPRSLGPADAHQHDVAVREGVAVALMQRGRMAVIEVEPARAGRNTVSLYLTDQMGQPVSPLEVEVELSNLAAGIAPLRRKLVRTQAGHYQYSGPELALAGRWILRLDLLINDFEKAILETEIAIR